MKTTHRLWSAYDQLPHNKRFIVAVALTSPVLIGNALLQITHNPIYILGVLAIIPVVLSRLNYLNHG